MILTMFQVDAFTEKLFQGNPAAVILLDEWLTDVLMQKIATENNLSETAFLKSSGISDGWELRWFSPKREVDFCGHATLAAAHILFTEYAIKGSVFLTTRAGLLNVKKLTVITHLICRDFFLRKFTKFPER